jgi:hypothetical protein
MTRKRLIAGCAAIWPIAVFAQGFGAVKQSVTLERKLPAAVRLPGNNFSVKTSAEAGVGVNCKAMAASKLQSLVETDLVSNNNQLIPNPAAPDFAISVRVLICSASSTPEYGLQLGKAPNNQQPTGFKVAANLSVTYEARGRDGRSVDAEPLDVKYNHEFNNAKAAITGLMGKTDQEPHTAEELVQVLAERMAERIAARLVNTNEKVEVLLGKGGPLDDANRYAVAGQWSKYVETLETMTPFGKPADDSYRLYNIGVGDEALGYKAETPAGAKKYFEQAVIQYRKAGEANPHEKYFIQPVNRIEIALEHYKILAQPLPPTEPAPPVAQPVATPAPVTAHPPAAPPAAVPAQPAAPAAARGGAAGFPAGVTWQVTEIINNVPVVWILASSADKNFRATMGDAAIANGTWSFDTAKRSFDLKGYNLVVRQPFTCTFNGVTAQSTSLSGVCLDQAGNRYKTDAVRQ